MKSLLTTQLAGVRTLKSEGLRSSSIRGVGPIDAAMTVAIDRLGDERESASSEIQVAGGDARPASARPASTAALVTARMTRSENSQPMTMLTVGKKRASGLSRNSRPASAVIPPASHRQVAGLAAERARRPISISPAPSSNAPMTSRRNAFLGRQQRRAGARAQ